MFINQQEKKISEQERFKSIGGIPNTIRANEIRNITITENKINLSNNKTLKKYKLNSGFSFGIQKNREVDILIFMILRFL